jgi:hypothetical protein
MSKVQFIRIVVSDAEKKLLQNAAAIDGLKLSPGRGQIFWASLLICPQPAGTRPVS